jgi:hypothetical protein
MKRRQYYNEHIKKYAKSTAAYNAEAESKKNYNEYKYILYATPLAVLLFLLIMKLASPGEPVLNNPPVKPKTETAKTPAASDLKMGDEPYAGFFGGPRYDTLHNQTLTVKNLTGVDVIVCLFTKTDFVRSFFIRSDYSAEVSQLPDEALYIRYSSGLGYDSTRKVNHTTLSGGFRQKAVFFKSLNGSKPEAGSELTLMPGTNEGFREIEEADFFKTTIN